MVRESWTHAEFPLLVAWLNPGGGLQRARPLTISRAGASNRLLRASAQLAHSLPPSLSPNSQRCWGEPPCRLGGSWRFLARVGAAQSSAWATASSGAFAGVSSAAASNLFAAV
jgi:hypothetical protein